MDREPEKIPDYDLLKEDEIAIYLDENNIFSLVPTCITKVFTKAGFKKPIFIDMANPKKGSNEITDVYLDGLRNCLLVTYRPSQIYFEDLGLRVIGYTIDPFAELYIEHWGCWTKVSVRNYVKMYEKNIFSNAISEFVKKIATKQHGLVRMFT